MIGEIYTKKEMAINASLALFLSANAIRSLVIRGASGSQMLLVAMLALPIVFIIILTKGVTVRNILKKQVLIVGLMLISLFVSYIKAPGYGIQSVQRIVYFFIIGGIGSLLIANYNYSFELLFRFLLIIGLIMAPTVIRNDYSTLSYEADFEEWMGVGYFVLLFVVAAIFYLFFGQLKWFKLFSILTILLYASLLLTHAARGTIVAILLSISVAFIQQGFINNRGSAKRLTIMVLLCVVLLALPFILDILEQHAENTTFVFLRKFMLDDDVSNGRFDLYMRAIEGFLEHPIIGKGVASFGNYKSYPHNVFLQLFYESGIIIALVMSIKIFWPIKYIFKNDYNTNNVNSKILLSFLIMISVVELLFSGTYWMKQAFWLYIWYGMYVNNHRYIQYNNIK